MTSRGNAAIYLLGSIVLFAGLESKFKLFSYLGSGIIQVLLVWADRTSWEIGVVLAFYSLAIVGSFLSLRKMKGK